MSNTNSYKGMLPLLKYETYIYTIHSINIYNNVYKLVTYTSSNYFIPFFNYFYLHSNDIITTFLYITNSNISHNHAKQQLEYISQNNLFVNMHEKHYVLPASNSIRHKTNFQDCCITQVNMMILAYNKSNFAEYGMKYIKLYLWIYVLEIKL